MGKRIYVLAKELGIETNHLATWAHALGLVKSKSPFSSIRNVEVEFVELQVKEHAKSASSSRTGRLKLLADALSISITHAQVSELFSVLEGMLREDDQVRNPWRYRRICSHPPAVVKLINDAVLSNRFRTATAGDLYVARSTRNRIVHRNPGEFPDEVDLRRVRNVLVAAILDYIEGP